MTLKGKRYNMTQIENLFYLEMKSGVEVNAVRTASEWLKVFAHASQDTIAKMPAWIGDMESQELINNHAKIALKEKCTEKTSEKGKLLTVTVH